MNSRFVRFLEGGINFAIILVIIISVLEEASLLWGWPLIWRNALLVFGFALDVIFTLEFFIRSIQAASGGKFSRYIRHEQGWIDFLASVPLLMFNSAPLMFGLLSVHGSAALFAGSLSLLKAVKLIRLTRIMRFLRILKLLRTGGSSQGNRDLLHLRRLASLVLMAFLGVLILGSLFEGSLVPPGSDAALLERTGGFVSRLQAMDPSADGWHDELSAFADDMPDILMVRVNGITEYSRFPDSRYRDFWSSGDYMYFKSAGLELFIDTRPLLRDMALSNLYYIFSALAILLALVLGYGTASRESAPLDAADEEPNEELNEEPEAEDEW